MVHKPKHRVHSFRGLLADGGQDEINLERQNVNLAYRVVKFQLMAKTPGATAREHVAKVTRESLSTINGVVDFTDVDLLAVGIWLASDNILYGTVSHDVIFDNVLFSRNIFVSQSDVSGANSCNYYIELEEVPVTAATLMQIKLGVARKLNLQQD
jgi:hypothetical protein